MGRGLRDVVTFRGKWLGLAAWQKEAFKCQLRDRWIGWKLDQHLSRLELIANNTRFLVREEPDALHTIAFFSLTQMTYWLAADFERG